MNADDEEWLHQLAAPPAWLRHGQTYDGNPGCPQPFKQRASGHGDDSFTVRLRLRLAGSPHHGGRCGQALWHTSRTWQDWTTIRIRSARLGVRIAVVYAQALVGCQMRREAADLRTQTRRTAWSRESVLEPIILPGSPTAMRLVAEHRPVCTRQLDTDGAPDLSAVFAAEQAWNTVTSRSHRQIICPASADADGSPRAARS
ncbi:hypothetical protein [Actinoplanes subglobosus]|uniref:Transposase n=1 Tax=Actinoplanes subglobosus TaxID=1547892 RepID=A0ABV8IKZ6_9ACTN